MTFDLHNAEQKLKNTSRLVQQSMWLLFAIAFGLIVVVGRSAPARTGSVWFFACAVFAFMFSFVLRDIVKKVGHRNTEDQIVKDVKVFLEREPDLPVRHTALPKVAESGPAEPTNPTPSRSAGFVFLQGAVAYCTPCADPVVFDAFPSRESVHVKTDFYAVLLPVVHNC
ncbi:MAG: hypothetical protein ABSF54_19275 [Bryobacteraceae bacterium]|jgi:hypothetical protein